MGSDEEGEKMRVDVEEDESQSKNIQGDVSVFFVITFVVYMYIYMFFVILYVFMFVSLHELMKGNSGRETCING